MRIDIYLLIIFLSLSSVGQSQVRISGTILDIETNSPVQFATVYIDGTTKGTITDSTGYFSLKKVKPPCTMIISHVGYKTFSTYFENRSYPELEFLLNPKDVFIQEICISDLNLRKRNLKLFRADFLGTDVWGKYATIENENAIYFTKEYEQCQVGVSEKQIPIFLQSEKDEIEWSGDSTIITYQKPISFNVAAKEPLIVDLPLLGYELYIDLISFVHKYTTKKEPEMSSFRGHFYFQPIKFKSKRDSIRIQKNRLKVYYNSPQHFCRSLYENRLLENGYQFHELIQDDSTLKVHAKVVNVDSLLIRENNIATIIGAGHKKYQISYFQNYRGTPVNLNEKRGYEPSISTMTFMDDTCRIRKDGTTPQIDILFGGPLSIKKVGAMLPNDYH